MERPNKCQCAVRDILVVLIFVFILICINIILPNNGKTFAPLHQSNRNIIYTLKARRDRMNKFNSTSHNTIKHSLSSIIDSTSHHNEKRFNSSIVGRKYFEPPLWNHTAMSAQAWRHMKRSWNPNLCLEGSGPLNPLPGYRATCWKERLDEATMRTAYRNNHYANFKKFHVVINPKGRRKIIPSLARLQKRYMTQLRASKGKTVRFRCLPSLYIIGVNKAGTSDLYDTVTKHPLLVEPLLKENKFPNFDSPDYVRFIDYLEMYDEIATKIQLNSKLLTIDANINYYTHYQKYMDYNQTSGNSIQKLLSSVYYIRSMNPNATLVMILRDPVTRIRSGYYYHYKGHGGTGEPTPEKLHYISTKNIESWKNCMKQHESISYCVHNFRTSLVGSAFKQNFYYVYVREILSLIPKNRVLFIHAESYYQNRAPVLKQIFKKMGLPPLSDQYLKKLAGTSVTNKGPSKQNGMLQKTENILREFYQPYNKLLANLLQNDKFLWQD